MPPHAESQVAEPLYVVGVEHVEAEATAAEPQLFETAVGEAQAAEETEIQHVEETELLHVGETATQPSVESEQVAPQVAAETSEQPSSVGAETTAEVAAPFAQTGQAALFEESADAVEATREAEHAPVGVAEETTASKEEVASKEEIAAGEWFEFDIQEARFESQPTAVEPASSVEASSGEAVSPAANEVGRAAEETQTFEAASTQIEYSPEPAHVENGRRASAAETPEKGVAPFDAFSTVPASIQQRIASREPSERAAAITELSHVDTDEAFQQICAAFDDEAKEVRRAAARALYELRPDRADSFTRALREATPERRRQIGAAISSSGLATEAISQLTGESREKTYEAFSLLFLMAK
ncbi:MAG: hypothetical protein DMF65_13630, partial [Acidobacteria bacterium]